MTSAFFTDQLERLAGLRFRPADFEGHWEACAAVPEDVFRAAVGRALRSQNDFPTPRELLTYCDLERKPEPITDEADRMVALPAPVDYTIPQTAQTIRVDKEWRYDCERCGDGGRISCWCAAPGEPAPKPWYHRRACERRGEHYAHEWVSPCPCAETNPTIQRRKAAQTRYAPEPSRRSA